MPLREFIKLSPRAYADATGAHLNLKQRIAFRLLKTQMKKEIKKNQHVTVGEFLSSKKGKEIGGSILVILLLIILFGFLIFVMTFQDIT